MLNYIRYAIAILLFSTLFYSTTITIPEETINSAVQKKLPIHISKKGFDITVSEIETLEVFEDSIQTNIIGEVKISSENSLGKYVKKDTGFLSKFFKKESREKFVNKSYNVDILSTVKPIINGSTLSFDPISMDINGVVKIDRFKGVLKRKLREIKIPIKQLEKYSFIGEIDDIKFSKNGDLNIDFGISKWILFALIFVFMLREVGMVLIELYQKFISPNKGYKCAKGHLHGNGTCSSDTKKAFKEGGFISGMKEYRKSTKECKLAYKEITDSRNGKTSACDLAICAGCDGSPLAFGSEATLSGMEVGGCEASACDIGGCGDIGACDVGAC